MGTSANVAHHGLFKGKRYFNDDISKSDVNSVIDMYAIFSRTLFNGDNISGWNCEQVIDMSFMFCRTSFNGGISGWNVSCVTSSISSSMEQPLNMPLVYYSCL